MSRLLFSECDTLVINPRLAKLIGLNEAIILQQIHYWIDNKYCAGHIHIGRKWIYNTVSQWHEQFPFMSVSTIKRAMLCLRDKGLIDVQKLSKDGLNHTNYYTVNYDQIDALKDKIEPIDKFKMSQPSGSDWSKPNRTETTAKTTQSGAAKQRQSSGLRVLQTYLDECAELGVKPISDNHPIRQYAQDAGITADMFGLCWVRFKEDHTEGARKSKRYKDWGQTFANCVKDNWYKFWYVKDGTVQLSSAGEMFKSAFEAKRAKGN